MRPYRLRFGRLGHQRQALIILGTISVFAATLATLLYESPLGMALERFCAAGIVAGLGWALGGLLGRKKHTLLIIYTLFTVVAIIGTLPLLFLIVFTINPEAGDNFANVNNRIDDALLGSMVKPNAWGHDANGYRNDEVPSNVDMVALGDSQTWGMNAPREDTWPYVLGDLTDQSVYNMGTIGFGPVEYWAQVQVALAELSPEVIVTALYFGNDFYDAYESVYLRDAFASRRKPDAEQILFDDTVGRLANEIGMVQSDAAYSDERVGTKFTVAYRSLAVQLDEPRIAEGMRITKDVLLDIHSQALAQGIRLVVMLLPTKESVYADLMAGQGDEAYDQLIRLEQAARVEVVSMLEANGIEYIDMLPDLRDALQAGQEVYLDTTDGHPSPRGYKVIAEAVFEKIRQD